MPDSPDLRARSAEVERARAVARLLDDAVAIPGTKVRIGLDPILGLLPGIGDVVGAALSGYIILVGRRMGAPKSVLLRMAVNIGIDSLAGAVPILGDVFDAGWKSNVRNVALLDRLVEQPAEARRSSRLFVGALLLGVTLMLVGAVYVGVALLWWLLGFLA